MNISETCEEIQEAIRSMQVFVKEITDMKEARVDEIFESIADAILVKLNGQPKAPTQLLDDNIAFGNTVASDIEIKSSAAEKAVITIINKFMDYIVDESVQNVKYNWMDPEKVCKYTSETKLTKGKYEPGILLSVSNIFNDKRIMYYSCYK